MTCVICSEEFEGQKNRIYLNCGHDFHCNCFFTLLSYNDNRCPLCREESDYQVPVANIQTRLTTIEHTHLDLTQRHSLLIAEYDLLNSNLTRTALQTTQFELELQLKIRENLNLVQENNRIKRDKLKLRNQVRELEHKINQGEGTSLDLIRIKTSLTIEKSRNKNLRKQLDDITTKNINYANNVDKTLSVIRSKMTDMDRSNRNMRYTNTVGGSSRYSSREFRFQSGNSTRTRFQ